MGGHGGLNILPQKRFVCKSIALLCLIDDGCLLAFFLIAKSAASPKAAQSCLEQVGTCMEGRTGSKLHEMRLSTRRSSEKSLRNSAWSVSPLSFSPHLPYMQICAQCESITTLRCCLINYHCCKCRQRARFEERCSCSRQLRSGEALILVQFPRQPSYPSQSRSRHRRSSSTSTSLRSMKLAMHTQRQALFTQRSLP